MKRAMLWSLACLAWLACLAGALLLWSRVAPARSVALDVELKLTYRMWEFMLARREGAAWHLKLGLLRRPKPVLPK